MHSDSATKLFFLACACNKRNIPKSFHECAVNVLHIKDWTDFGEKLGLEGPTMMVFLTMILVHFFLPIGPLICLYI